LADAPMQRIPRQSGIEATVTGNSDANASSLATMFNLETAVRA
jgi:hypothetical protein